MKKTGFYIIKDQFFEDVCNKIWESYTENTPYLYKTEGRR